MSDNQLEQIILSVARRMRTDFDLSGGFTHSGEKGTTRERVFHDFLKDYLPGHVRAFHGAEIISVDGQKSNQCDIVICDRSTPPLLDMQGYRIVPNECVYGLIEVKSKLDKKELRDACDKICRAKKLPKSAYQPAPTGQSWTAIGGPYSFPTVGMIFAFDSIEPLTLGKHFAEWCEDHEPHERPDAIWILGKSYFGWIRPGELALRSSEPGANCHLVDPPPEGDVLFPLAIYLNAAFSSAWMPPFRLLDYAAGGPLGTSHKCWEEQVDGDTGDPPIAVDSPESRSS
ncbi:DUF6602 domain-containing protein [Kitasatospora sp. NPDC052868]|uniref:DUF6602 domain-containing protein n=1 Tax=Kitasatospora sp. NPDC052868 TaxID=3364060 RepID=UPI0037CA6E17